MTEPESSIFKKLRKTWTPFFNGVTTFYDFVNLDGLVKSQHWCHCERSEAISVNVTT